MVSYQALHQRWRVLRFYVTNPRYIVWLLRNRLIPELLLPARLHSSAWWLAANDFVGEHVFLGEYFENAEQNFLEDYLKAGMTFLDIGAHHGLYALLASRRVGPTGRVIAFEPSPREVTRLKTHLSLNRCTNVRVEQFALGKDENESELFICFGKNGSGFNSLRPPNTDHTLAPLKVKVQSLDSYLSNQGIRVEEIAALKMDVEGGELDILRGATRMLSAEKRPIIMCEVEDIRTETWGYKAKEIFDYLEGFKFSWFSIAKAGHLIPLSGENFPQGNLIAVPIERLPSVSALSVQLKANL
jgi:FkbM family methyltransferase